MMKITLSVAEGEFCDKAKCGKVTKFETAELDLQDEVGLEKFFTSRVHSAWKYDGPRNSENTVALLAVPFDFDDGHGMTFEKCVERFKSYAGVVYTTSSYSVEQPKMRVLLALSTPITNPEAFQPICDWLKGKYPDADPEVFKISQPLFPCCKYDRVALTPGYSQFRLQVLNGTPFYFPPEALRPKQASSDTGAWEEPPSQYDEKNKSELSILLEYYKANPIKEGTRDRELVNLCAKYRQCGYSKDEAFETLCKVNVECVEPPYQKTGKGEKDKSIEEIVRHVYENEVKPPAPDKWPALQVALEQIDENVLVGDDLEQLLLKEIKTMPLAVQKAFFPAIAGSSEIGTRKKISPLKQLATEMYDNPALSWMQLYKCVQFSKDGKISIPFLFPRWQIGIRKTVTMIYGEDKAGKGALLSNLYLEKGSLRILHFNADEPDDDFINRNTTIGLAPADEDLCYVSRPQSWQRIAIEVHRFTPDIITLDALVSILRSVGDEPPEGHADDTHAARILYYLDVLASSYNCALLLLHHANRDRKDRHPRGNMMLTAGVSTKVFVNTNKQKDTTTLEFDGRRDHDKLVLKYVGKYKYVIDDLRDLDKKLVTKSPYSEAEKRIWKALIDNKSIMRKDIEKRANITPGKLNAFAKRFPIQITKTKNGHMWRATPEQINEAINNGIQPEGIWKNILEESEE